MTRIIGYVDEFGRYHRGVDKSMPHTVNALHKNYSHDMQRREFAREIIQPRVNGKPNPEFVRNYHGYSKKYFSQEEIDEALRP